MNIRRFEGYIPRENSLNKYGNSDSIEESFENALKSNDHPILFSKTTGDEWLNDAQKYFLYELVDKSISYFLYKSCGFYFARYLGTISGTYEKYDRYHLGKMVISTVEMKRKLVDRKKSIDEAINKIDEDLWQNP